VVTSPQWFLSGNDVQHPLATMRGCTAAGAVVRLNVAEELATIGHYSSVHVRVFESSKARPLDLCVRIED